MSDLKAAIAEAEAILRTNEKQVARELLAWHKSGTLSDGFVRRAASALEGHIPHNALSVAEKLAHTIILNRMAAS